MFKDILIILFAHLQEQNSCVGEQATSLTVDVHYEQGSAHFPNITGIDKLQGNLTFDVNISEPESGTIISSVITLINTAGSTTSQPIYTRTCTNFIRSFPQILKSSMIYDGI